MAGAGRGCGAFGRASRCGQKVSCLLAANGRRDCPVDHLDLIRARRASRANSEHPLAAAALWQNHATRSYQAALETAPGRVEHHSGGPIPHRREMLPDACYR